MSALLALVAGPGDPRAVRPLVRALGALIEVRSLGRCGRGPDAVLSTGPIGAQGLFDLPVAEWRSGGVDAGADRIEVPPAAFDVAGVAPRGTLVRARWRDRLGLPEVMFAEVDGEPSDGDRDALANCSVAVVTGSALALALALGTPVVTDGESAAAVGARNGVEVVIVAADARADAARRLAEDPARSARMGTEGRRLAERQLDLSLIARRVLDSIGLEVGGRSTLDLRLGEMHLPRWSSLGRRVDLATNGYEGMRGHGRAGAGDTLRP